MGIVPVEKIIARQRKRIIKGSLLAAAALIVISAVSLWFVLLPNQPLPVATFETAPDSAFSLSHSGDAPVPEGMTLTVGSSINLTRGTLEVELRTGVRIVADAPCQFDLLAQDRIALQRGSAWFHVPQKAKGFAVETSRFTVVDLGTEFGIISRQGEEQEVHVIKGEVEVTSANQEKESLIAKEARRTTTKNDLENVPFNSDLFRTKLPASVTLTVANHSFEADDVSGEKQQLSQNLVPSGWLTFDDGRNKASAGDNLGIVSHAKGSTVSRTLEPTPDPDDQDQSFFTAQRDLYQVLPSLLEPGMTYTLLVDIGDRRVKSPGGEPGSPVARLGTGMTPGQSLLKLSRSKKPAQVDGGWVTWSYSFDTSTSTDGLGKPLRIELTNGTNVGWFDNVRLSVRRKIP